MRSLLGKKLKPAYLGGFLVLVVFIILLGLNLKALDPDFGWHLRLGQVITQSGIPRTDPFSYTMPSYSYVDVEWLANVIFAKTYSLLGFFGLAFFTTLLTVITLVIISGLENWPLFILATTPILSFIIVRPMILTWFFLALLVTVIFNPQRWKKWRLLAPIVFFLWANLHAGMAAGMALLFVFVAVEIIRTRRLDLKDAVVCLVSLLATLINPYGWLFWKEIILTVFHLGVGAQIGELMPAYSGFDPAVLTIAVLSAILVLRYRKKFVWEITAVYVLFLVSGFLWIRNLPLMIIVSIPIISQGIIWLTEGVGSSKEQKRRFSLASRLAVWYCLLIFLGELIIAIFNQTKMSENHFYPKMAVSYLKNNLPTGQIFSEYGWGGYLDWKLPQKKVFIDGRMPYWQSESLSIFKEYNDISEGKKDLDKIFTKYGIETVLWSTKKNSGFDFENALRKIGWKKIYQDQVSVIYTK